jgi:hypothetical protein
MIKFFHDAGGVEYVEEIRSAFESYRSLEERIRNMVRHELMVSNVKIGDDASAHWGDVLE